MNKQIKNNDQLPIGLTILSNAFPPIGFFLYFRHRNQSPNKARKALLNAFIGIPIALALGYVMNTYLFM
jgi:hypothetical protein